MNRTLLMAYLIVGLSVANAADTLLSPQVSLQDRIFDPGLRRAVVKFEALLKPNKAIPMKDASKIALSIELAAREVSSQVERCSIYFGDKMWIEVRTDIAGLFGRAYNITSSLEGSMRKTNNVLSSRQIQLHAQSIGLQLRREVILPSNENVALTRFPGS